MTFYELKAKDVNGNEIEFSEYKGKVILVVNTATGCGFTPQYEGLQKLYDAYKDNGLEILDFPCNQFLGQAPGTDSEIVSFCQLKYGVTFKQFSKINVNGKDQHPVFAYLKSKKGGIMGKRIKWNFTKFLINRDGEVVARYAPTVKPEKIEDKIKELL